MHCPNCGNESSLDQKYCRQCGFSLEVVGKLLSEHRPTGKKPEPEQISDDKIALNRMVRWMMWGLLVLLVGVVATVANKQFLADRLASLIGTLVMLAGVSIAAYGVLDAMRVELQGAGDRSCRKTSKTVRQTKRQRRIPLKRSGKNSRPHAQCN